MHKLLLRQLRRHGLDLEALPPQVRALLGDVDTTYADADDDRRMLERSLDLTSLDLIGRNQLLRDDLAQHERTAEALRSSEQRLQMQLQQRMLGAIEWDIEGRVTEWNPAAERVFGFARQEVIGRYARKLIEAPGLEAQNETAWQALLLKEGGRELRIENLRKDGVVIVCEWHNTPVVDAAGKVVAVASLVQDVTEKARAEAALRQSEEEFRLLAAATLEGLIIHDGTEILLANPAMARLLGREASRLVGRSCGELWPAFSDVALLLREGGPHEVCCSRPDGTTLDVEIQVRPILYRDRACQVVALRDVTERRRLQGRLMASDRMASIGTLAAGVAHEVNNPLAYVLSNLEYVREHVTLDDLPRGELAALLDEALHGAERVRNIVRDLKTFSRSDDGAPQPVDINKVLELSVAMAANEIKHRARLIRDYREVPKVQGNASRIGQVLLNLVINAAQAIPVGAADANVIRVSTRLIGRSVEVTVSDTGPGIPAALHQRIFEPFFTTKPTGVGTGLGLSICHNLITAMGGEISVESEPGRGATFRVLFRAS